MKLRYLFSAILASVLVFAGCEEVSTDSWDNIKLSQTYLSISEEGGSVELTINATDDWAIDTTYTQDVWPNVISRDKEDKNIIKSCEASWLKATVREGAAGETKITFTADATTSGRELELKIFAGENAQFVKVRQGSMTVTEATCAEVIAGPEGKLYQVTGICTAIANTSYGNWYLNDGTGEIYIYGTKNASGQYDWANFGIEVGDEVTVQGAYVLYNGTTPEFVDATFISVEKSLVKVVTESQTYPKEGGEFEVKVAYKGAGVFPTVPEEYRSWVSVVDMQNIPGEATKIEPNPADTAVVKLAIQPNDGGDRVASVTFVSSSSSVPYEFTQTGAIVDATVAEFLAAEEGATQYRVTGVVKELSVSAQYHNANITITGGAGEELYLYRLVASEGNIEDAGLAAGDLITVVGTRGSYKGSPQMAQGGKLETMKRYEVKTVAEFLAAPEGDTEYAVTGEIVGIKDLSESYNNVGITIKDGGDEVFLYRVKTFDGTNVVNLNLEVGGKITVAGKRSSYKDTPQMAAGGICLSYTAPAAGEGGSDAAAAWSLGAANQTWTEATHATYGAGYSTTIDGVGLAYYKYNSQTDPIAPKDDHIRVYQDSYFVITPATGKKIKSVTIECAGDKTGPIKVGETEYTATDNVITWTGDVDVFEAYAVKQTRIAKVTVVSE